MDFELLLSSNQTQKDYAYHLIQILKDNLNTNFKFVEDHDSINLCLDCMTISIDL